MNERSVPSFLVMSGGVGIAFGIALAWVADLAATPVSSHTSPRVATAATMLFGCLSTLFVQWVLIRGWRRFVRSHASRGWRGLGDDDPLSAAGRTRASDRRGTQELRER